MALIRPFQGVRYRTRKSDDLQHLIAPPYDVITSSHRETLFARAEHNTIRLILGDPSNLPAKELADTDRYQRAGELFRHWLSETVLIRDEEPSLYLVEDQFEWEGIQRTRTGLLLSVQLEPFDRRIILPHERTLAQPIEDRLRLMEATRAHLSPVYMTVDDRSGDLRTWITRFTRTPPIQSFQNLDEPIHHRFWRIPKGPDTEKLSTLLAPKPFLIADGHHRYTTALQLRDNYGGQWPEAAWGLAYLAAVPDEGVVLSAIHRILETTVRVTELLRRLTQTFSIESVPLDEPSFERSNTSLSLLDPGTKKLHTLLPHASAVASLPAELRSIPSVVLNELIVRPHLGIDLRKLEDQTRVTYVKKAGDVLSTVGSGQLGFWLKPTTVTDILAAARSGHVLPQKSTYFYPKVMTGFVFHPFDQ